MKKLPGNRNILILLVMVFLIFAVIIASRLIDFFPDTLPDLPIASATAAPDETGTQAPAAQAIPLGYILAQANGESKWIPLPTNDEDLLISITRQDDPTVSNTLRLMKNGFRMDSSTCDNQDCVFQGEVTLENKEERVLMHMVLCLPHNVIVELYSTEELIAMLEQSPQQAN